MAGTDRPYAEVGRDMARWLAENDPRATPLADYVLGEHDLGAGDLARLETLLSDHFGAFARGYLQGVIDTRKQPEWRVVADPE